MVLLHHASDSLVGERFPDCGYLAVDFFFMLSGFVLAAVYEPRFAQGMTFRPFAAVRLKRLYPTMAIGIVFGALVLGLPTMPLSELWYRLVAQLLFVPIFHGNDGLYPLDGVQWSLFFEFLANALHVLVLWRLSNRKLGLVCLLCFLAFLAILWSAGDFVHGDRGGNFIGGFPRALFPYTLGILLYRVKDRLPAIEIGAVSLFIALPAVLIGLDLASLFVAQWVAELLVVALFFPVLIHLGSQAVTGRLTGMADAFGRLSYPLYAIHLPMLIAFMLIIQSKGLLVLALGMWWAVAGAYYLMRFTERAAAKAKEKGTPGGHALRFS